MDGSFSRAFSDQPEGFRLEDIGGAARPVSIGGRVGRVALIRTRAACSEVLSFTASAPPLSGAASVS